VAVDTEPARSVTLCCSILKRENFELVVQKATELGVSRIIPIIAERTVKTGLKMERLKAIAKEATEQSGRGVVPDISEPMSLTDALALPGHKLFFHTGTQAHPALSSDPALLFIGPEGGWSDRDVAAAVSAGCQVCSLGKRTLRGETAAIVACYQAVA
jgi:16S rRNA (uracil1498-N3)-methyltransferase